MASRRPGTGSIEDAHIQQMHVRVGVIGCGYWGPHLIRTLHHMPGVELVGVAEERQDRLRYVSRSYPAIRPFSDHRQLLQSDLDAVVIATPTRTHFELTSEALLAGKHVLVEKPLASSSARAAELVALAHQRGRVLMVGTGYRPDLARLEFFEPWLRDRIATSAGRFRLDGCSRPSVPGLHFVEALAEHDFGPLCRFVAAAALAAGVERRT
jgi:NAD-dependent oxidoreductase involved in siderophore biosynthesis